MKKSARSIAAPILRLSEGVASDVALAINREIGRYLDVYRFVTGPVGSDLSCHVTYNRRNILSFYFSGPPIRYRAYSVKSINDGPSWKEVERYAFVSPCGEAPTHAS